MRYAQYYNSESQEALGSDSYCPLDARFSLLNSMQQATEHGLKLNKNLGKGYTHFQIRRGSDLRPFSSFFPLTKLRTLEE